MNFFLLCFMYEHHVNLCLYDFLAESNFSQHKQNYEYIVCTIQLE